MSKQLVTEEGVDLIVAKPTVSFFVPWYDRVMNGEDPLIYEKRHTSSGPLIMIYTIIVILIAIVATIFYRKDNYLLTIFLIGIVWWLFGSISIWYLTLHQDIYAGIVLMFIFVILLIAFGYTALEKRRIEIEIVFG